MENNGSKTFLFPTWDSWRVYTEKAVIGFAKCLISILYSIIIGLVTLLYNAFVAIKKIVFKYPVYSLGILCAILFVLLMVNYARFSAKVKTCEIQRDSIGYELYKIEQALGGDTIIVEGHLNQKGKMGLLTTDLNEEPTTKENGKD